MSVLASFKARAAQLKREVLAIYLAAKHPRTPWYSKLVVVAIVAYVLSPIDLIPDFIPVLGLLDEIILLPLALVLVVKLVPEDVMSECRARALEYRPEGTALGRLGAALIIVVWLALIVLAFVWMSGAARAQGWPSKPIRLVSPFPPGAVVDTLCRTPAWAASAASLRLPATRERLESLGLTPAPGAPGELAALVGAELERWAKVARAANLKPE